jgi:hypothetical protein
MSMSRSFDISNRLAIIGFLQLSLSPESIARRARAKTRRSLESGQDPARPESWHILVIIIIITPLVDGVTK